ncbi:MAG: hypothetical protein M0P99_07810 [Candidatus Cloacimonetes bacterium]|nr:hypothetical protein [Candidatus Cloacimonadota bacterium]
MKRFTLVLIFAFVFALLTAAVGITSVNMEDHNGAVVRVVVSLTAKGDYKILANAGSLEFRLNNFISNSTARIATKDSNLVNAIEQDGALLRISVKHPYRYETTVVSYPTRVVIDIFKRTASKAERITIAEFYSEIGKLQSADKAYNDLHIDYRQDTQILYQWAVLLHKRGSSRASEKLFAIPTGAPYFKQAQKLMAILHSDNEPEPFIPDDIEADAEVPLEVMPAITESVATFIPPAAPVAKPKAPAPKQKPMYLMPILYIAGGLLVVVVLIFIFIFARKKKKPVYSEPITVVDSSTSLDTSWDTSLDNKTLCLMVSKLLSDGWSVREISKELKISVKEVERLVQICDSGVNEDQDT